MVPAFFFVVSVSISANLFKRQRCWVAYSVQQQCGVLSRMNILPAGSVLDCFIGAVENQSPLLSAVLSFLDRCTTGCSAIIALLHYILAWTAEPYPVSGALGEWRTWSYRRRQDALQWDSPRSIRTYDLSTSAHCCCRPRRCCRRSSTTSLRPLLGAGFEPGQ